MLKATILQLLAQRKRLIGVGLAIMIGVGFMAITMLAGKVLDQGFRNSVGAEYQHIDFIVESGETSLAGSVDEVEAVDGVADVQPGAGLWIAAEANGRSANVTAVEMPGAGNLRDALVLKSGRLPETTGEITMHRSAARELRIKEGDTISLMVPPASETGGQAVQQAFTVVGIWTGEGRFGEDEFTGILMPDDFVAWSGGLWIPTLFVTVDTGADLVHVEQALFEAVGSDATVVTASQKIDAELEEFADQSAVLKLGINAFAVLALIVGGIVVSNTFAILIAQRTREIALFRCAGATSRQVRNMVLGEALVLGVAASAIGVIGAIVVANVALRLVDAQFDFASISASVGISAGALVLPLIAGAVLAVAAAWAPARSATRIDPLQALRVAQSPVGAGQRPGPIRVAISILLLLGGAILLLAGAAISHGGSPEPGVVTGMAGGLTTFLGVLVGASVLVPATVAAFGRLVAQFGGVPARVAASNSVRNPRRTTATTIALVIGVALVTMMSVGAESLKASLVDEIDVQTPWDMAVTKMGTTGDLPDFAAMSESAIALDGVVASAPLPRLEVEIAGQAGGESTFAEVRVIDPEALAAVLRDPDIVSGFETGIALIPGWVTDMTGIDDGDPITLRVGGEQLKLQAKATSSFESIMLTAGDVEPLGVGLTTDEFWLRLDDEADSNEVMDDLYDLADANGLSISVGGFSGYRETLTTALDALLFITTALLGVAVLIAIIGVGNTLSLSVIERARESALMRALGFTRKQLRQSLAVEAMLLALIGCLIGIVLGTAFGWIGAITVVGDELPIALVFPLTRIGLIVAIAVICGLVASVLPARRAAQADPVVALAEV